MYLSLARSTGAKRGRIDNVLVIDDWNAPLFSLVCLFAVKIGCYHQTDLVVEMSGESGAHKLDHLSDILTCRSAIVRDGDGAVLEFRDGLSWHWEMQRLFSWVTERVVRDHPNEPCQVADLLGLSDSLSKLLHFSVSADDIV